MKKSIQSVFFASVFLLVLLSGCAPASTPFPPTLSPFPTHTPLPTLTPIPTDTPKPTKTPMPPTATIQAPDKILEFLNGVQVVYFDTFDNPARGGWLFDAGKVKDGILEVIGKNWNGLFRDRNFNDNQGIVIDFSYTKGSVFEMYVASGDWYTDPYKRFGIYVGNNNARVNEWAGTNGLGGANLSGNFVPKPDTTYSLLIALLPDGKFLGVIWDPSDPSKTIYYREDMGKYWSNLTWKFALSADSGTILFDNYREITFDSVK